MSLKFDFRRFLVISVMLCSSCSYATSTPVEPTPFLKPTPLPTKTVLPVINSPTPVPTCPNINPDTKFIPPKSNSEIVNIILSFINAGGDLSQINSYFAQFQVKTLDAVAVDLNEDGLNEIIIAGALPLEPRSSGEGVIYIFGCRQKSYKVDKQFDFQNISSAKIIRTEKLLVDYPQQVLLLYHPITGWASYVLAIGFMDGDWKVVFQDEVFFPKLVVFDQDKDGNKEISLHSITTATQGPQRTIVSTFKWNGKEYALISDQLMPGTTRVEYLDDAQTALDSGDISMAIAYYDRAAHDSSLDNFASRDEIERNQMNLSGNYQISFALFRLASLWLSVGDLDKGISIIQELKEQFQANSPGNEFTQAANLFHNKIEQGKTPNEACTSVTSFLSQNYPDLNIHIGDWGVSVVGYTQLIELCPFH